MTDRRAAVSLCIAVLALATAGCAPHPRVYTEGVLAADHRLMSKPELIRHLDRVESELARVHAGGAAPEGVPADVYTADLQQRMRDVQREIGLRNTWERKSCRERREMWGPTR